jgi:hypothetical protein
MNHQNSQNMNELPVQSSATVKHCLMHFILIPRGGNQLKNRMHISSADMLRPLKPELHMLETRMQIFSTAEDENSFC